MTRQPKPLRALIVEDDCDQARLLERWLQTLHCFFVATAPDGLEGQRLAERGGWDIVITDVQLPGSSGIDVLRTSKELHPRTPALVLTAHACIEAAMEALRVKADDFLLKPIDSNTFRLKVEQLIVESRKGHNPRRVLAIGAHYDDIEIGCGGILCRHASAGDEVTSLVLTDGSLGGTSARRHREAKKACAELGASLYTAGLPDTSLSSGTATIEAISRVLKGIQPTIVYTHSPHDTHQDHRSAHQATLVAARSVDNIFCYEAPSTTTDFKPTRFVDIAPYMERKLELLQHYGSQAGRPYLQTDIIKATARYWGRFSGYGVVEALEVIRAVDLSTPAVAMPTQCTAVA